MPYVPVGLLQGEKGRDEAGTGPMGTVPGVGIFPGVVSPEYDNT